MTTNKEKLRQWLSTLLPRTSDRTIFDGDLKAVIDLCRPIINEEPCQCGDESTAWTTFPCCNLCRKIVEREQLPKTITV